MCELVGSRYDSCIYIANEEQEEALRIFWRAEDNRPENQPIPTDKYGDNALCLDKEFGGVLSGKDRPRNKAEYEEWRRGGDWLCLREKNNTEAKKRWLEVVKELGLKKYNTPKEPLIKDEKIRKAVKAWAEADGADEKIYLTKDDNGSRFANKYGGYIEFAFQIDIEERLYTLAELCGEE